MPAPILAPEEIAALGAAAKLLSAGHAEVAVERIAPLIARGSRHPDLLILYSAACERAGKARDAAGALRAALEVAPERADIWANLGRMMHEQGQSAQGAELLEKCVALDRSKAEYWYNLGLASNESGNAPRAIEALQQATGLSPRWAMAWAVLGQIQFKQNQVGAAELSLRKAFDVDPESAFVRHTLAIVLRRLDRSDEALALIGEQTDQAAETRLVRAHLLGDSGRFDEALEIYRALVRERPQLLDAHETLARLLPQVAAASQALDSYREAITREPTVELYRSAIITARDLKDPTQMLAWAKEALARFGRQPDLIALHGLALGLGGDGEGALAELEPLAETGFAPVLAHCAYYRLKLGDPGAAETHALAATRADPLEQTAWSYLTVIWRLLDDAREAWLADYDRLVMPVDIAPPDGFATTEEFMAALAAELSELHTTRHHPLEQSLREGTQTRGLLFNRQLSLVQALVRQLDSQIGGALSQLPVDANHPFLGRNTGRVRFAGSWSVRLRSGGFHISHIHHTGWLSSALYVSLPEEVAKSEQEGGPGALAFGVPDQALGLDLPPRRVETPRVGRLVIFPSYFWHGTIPFKSAAPRLTVAFDALPD
jgi:tetratricopeptide (TPR) repeat protein